MSAIDAAMHDFMSDPHIFSDFINTFIFDGQPIIAPESLSNEDSNLAQFIYNDKKQPISILLNIPWLIKEKEKYISKEGCVDMCTAIKEWYEEALSEGKTDGLNLAGEIIKRKKDGETPEAIALALKLDRQQVYLITHLLE